MKHPTRVLASVAIVSSALVACSDGVKTGAAESGTHLLAALTQSFDVGTGGGLLQDVDQATAGISEAV